MASCIRRREVWNIQSLRNIGPRFSLEGFHRCLHPLFQLLGRLDNFKVGEKRVRLCALGKSIEEIEGLSQSSYKVAPCNGGILFVAELEKSTLRVHWVLPDLCSTEFDADL